MTIAAIVGIIIFGTIITIGGFAIGSYFPEKRGRLAGTIIGLVITLTTFLFSYWYFNNTESGLRALKSQESNFNSGIERRVTVYDMNGDIIQTYEGKFDVAHEGDKILFDDENGLRHIIYYQTGTVIIDEI